MRSNDFIHDGRQPEQKFHDADLLSVRVSANGLSGEFKSMEHLQRSQIPRSMRSQGRRSNAISENPAIRSTGVFHNRSKTFKRYESFLDDYVQKSAARASIATWPR
jgi:hypothetical protein